MSKTDLFYTFKTLKTYFHILRVYGFNGSEIFCLKKMV